MSGRHELVAAVGIAVERRIGRLTAAALLSQGPQNVCSGSRAAVEAMAVSGQLSCSKQTFERAASHGRLVPIALICLGSDLRQAARAGRRRGFSSAHRAARNARASHYIVSLRSGRASRSFPSGPSRSRLRAFETTHSLPLLESTHPNRLNAPLIPEEGLPHEELRHRFRPVRCLDEIGYSPKQ
jgi:hypothetical protein